jgi:hypothetical protein
MKLKLSFFIFSFILTSQTWGQEVASPQVVNFDIVGFKIRTTYAEVIKRLANKNFPYTLKQEETAIPEKIRFNYDSECRGDGITVPNMIESCIQSKGEASGWKYVSKMTLVRPLTNENIDIYFTSPQKFNSIYKIVYTNPAPKIIGDSKSFQYQRDLQMKNFFSSVVDKYGKPNASEDTWKDMSLGEASPTLKYYYGGLVLQNSSLYAEDIALCEKAAQASFKSLPLVF